MTFQETTKEEFIADLISHGWTREQAEGEWERVQDDEESGYDGPLGAS